MSPTEAKRVILHGLPQLSLGKLLLSRVYLRFVGQIQCNRSNAAEETKRIHGILFALPCLRKPVARGCYPLILLQSRNICNLMAGKQVHLCPLCRPLGSKQTWTNIAGGAKLHEQNQGCPSKAKVGRRAGGLQQTTATSQWAFLCHHCARMVPELACRPGRPRGVPKCCGSGGDCRGLAARWALEARGHCIVADG